MRIAHLTNAYAERSGGIRTTAHALGGGYAAAGHQLVLVVPGRRDGVVAEPWGRRVELRGVPVPRSGGYRVVLRRSAVRRALEELDPDVVEVSDRLTMRDAGAWARERGKPSVLLAHERLDGVLPAFAPVPPRVAVAWADRHNRWTARLVDRVVATTRYAAVEFERIGVDVAHVPLGVDLQAFSPRLRADPFPGEGARDGSGAGASGGDGGGGGGALLVLCSRLSREKRPDLAVEALRVLRREGLPARLVVAGAGPEEARLRRLATGLPVRFVGYLQGRREVAALLASADVVVAPGPVETFGLAALEALACGTPVVASRTSALAEVVGDGGRVGEPTPEGVAAAVLDVLGEHPWRRRAAARTQAERFPWSATVDRMLALHEELMTAHGWRRAGLNAVRRRPGGVDVGPGSASRRSGRS